MKNCLLFLIVFGYSVQQCIVVKDASEIAAKIAENKSFEGFDAKMLENDQYYQKNMDNEKEILTRISCFKSKSNVSLCQDFFIEYKMFFESEKDNMMCIIVLKECEVEQQHFLLRLNMNIYDLILQQNSYELVIQFLGGINRLLLKGIKTKLLPIHDKQPDSEKEQNNQIPFWITTLGHFITKEGIMLVFTGKMQTDPGLIDGKFLNPNDIGFLTEDYVTLIKEFFEQQEVCDDIVHAFYTHAGEGLLEVMDEDEFPQSYISTWNWLEENINQGLVEKHKWLMFFVVVAFCEGKIIYDESILHVLHQILNVQTSYLLDSQEEIDYFRDYFVYKVKMDKAQFEVKKASYVASEGGQSNKDEKKTIEDEDLNDQGDQSNESIDDEGPTASHSVEKNISKENTGKNQLPQNDPDNAINREREKYDQEMAKLIAKQKKNKKDQKIPTNQSDQRLRKLLAEKMQLQKILESNDIEYKKQFMLKHNYQLNFKDQLNHF